MNETVTSATSQVTPTYEDAQRIARVLADEHAVGSVLLFGSVAKGEAEPGSDLDLIAVYDDLDYRTRHKRRLELKSAARACVGFDIDLKVTDRPEWQTRSQSVRNSFEYGISDSVRTLLDGIRHPVRWEKEIDLPNTEQDETGQHIHSMANEINLVSRMFVPMRAEVVARVSNDLMILDDERRQRLSQVCASSAMAIEHGLKAIRAMVPLPLLYSHSGTDLVKDLPPRSRRRCKVVSEQLLESIEDWRQAGTYSSILEDLNMSTEELYQESLLYLDAMTLFADQVLAEYVSTYSPSNEDTAASKLSRYVHAIRTLRTEVDLWSGEGTDR